ncbi:hypothetical protein PU02_0542 [Bartonella ancashensis]|uniref:Uncharacterized protein n=1 Tax=Bartonella ancashensis TaxID=1318743 RepID=A0A0M4LI66_9HYPH|nr:hypothetical protein PU02_0542 [Bartonella ancashensis]
MPHKWFQEMFSLSLLFFCVSIVIFSILCDDFQSLYQGDSFLLQF